MSQLVRSSEQIESESETIERGLARLGLSLSELELNELRAGKRVSLANRGLDEIGQIFILASAILPIELGKPKKSVTFEELLSEMTEATRCPGIPIYSWTPDASNRCCLSLTLSDGQLALQLCRGCPGRQEAIADRPFSGSRSEGVSK